MSSCQFFPTEEPALRAALDSYLEWLAGEAAKENGFRALLLGGGYGRGEGGVFLDSRGCAKLYNDLEFYYFGSPLPAGVIKRWAHEGEERLGIEIEFKSMTPEAFARVRPSMFYYDLLSRHVLVAGSDDWVASLPQELSSAASIPPEEASRLLVNRGMSLLSCLRWADGNMELPPGFCDRIAAKLKLALADSVLCSVGRYDWSCRERDRRLASQRDVPPDWEKLVAWHAEGLSFKLHPRHTDFPPADWKQPLEELRRAWVSTFLWIESRRLGLRFENARDYKDCRGSHFSAEPVWSNLMRQARDLRRSSRVPFLWGDHPRSAIWKSLALLMEGGASGEEHAATLLGKPALRGRELEEHCRACWKHYP